MELSVEWFKLQIRTLRIPELLPYAKDFLLHHLDLDKSDLVESSYYKYDEILFIIKPHKRLNLARLQFVLDSSWRWNYVKSDNYFYLNMGVPISSYDF